MEQPTPAGDRPIGGSVIAGFTHALHDPYLLQISLYMLLYTIRQRSFIFKQFTIDGRLVISSNLSNQWVL